MIIDPGSLYLQTFPINSNLDGRPANAHSRLSPLKSARRPVTQGLRALPAPYCPPDPRKFRCAPRPRPSLKNFTRCAPCALATLPTLEPGPHQSVDPGPLLPALCGCMPRPSAIMAPSVAWPACRWPPTGVPGPGLVQSHRIARQRRAIRDSVKMSASAIRRFGDSGQGQDLIHASTLPGIGRARPRPPIPGRSPLSVEYQWIVTRSTDTSVARSLGLPQSRLAMLRNSKPLSGGSVSEIGMAAGMGRSIAF